MNTKSEEAFTCQNSNGYSEKSETSMDGNGTDQAQNTEEKVKPEEALDEQKSHIDYEKIIEKKQNEIDEYKSRWLRARADFENYKKRTQKKINDVYLYANEELMKDILPIIDNLERALESTKLKDDALHKGVELIYQQFIKMLEKYEVKEIEALGKPFDPSYHDAVMVVESDEYETDSVAEVMLKGYMYHSKVIRPSMVKIAKN